MNTVNELSSLMRSKPDDEEVAQAPAPNAVQAYRPFTVWFRAPRRLAALARGKIAVIAYAESSSEAVNVALASGIYAYTETKNSNAFVFDGVQEGLPRDLAQ